MKKVLFLLVFLFVTVIHVTGEMNIDSDSLRFLDKGNVSEFLGNVKITMPNLEVTSDKAISRKQEGTINAEGKVYVKYSSDTWNLQGWCSDLEMFINKGFYVMTGNVKTKYSTFDEEADDNVTEVYADKITFNYSGNQKALFEGNVKAERKQVTVNSGRAEYLRADERIDFSGSPRILSLVNDIVSEYTGDLIVLFLKGENIKITGNANSRVFIKDELRM